MFSLEMLRPFIKCKNETPYNLFLMLYKKNNKIIDNNKLKLEWFKIKNGNSELYPNLDKLKSIKNTKNLKMY